MNGACSRATDQRSWSSKAANHNRNKRATNAETNVPRRWARHPKSNRPPPPGSTKNRPDTLEKPASHEPADLAHNFVLSRTIAVRENKYTPGQARGFSPADRLAEILYSIHNSRPVVSSQQSQGAFHKTKIFPPLAARPSGFRKNSAPDARASLSYEGGVLFSSPGNCSLKTEYVFSDFAETNPIFDNRALRRG